MSDRICKNCKHFREHFEPGTEPTDAFISKAYLSRELLQYILNLELLPEISDEPIP